MIPEYLDNFALGNESSIPFQPALKKVFASEASKEVTPKQSVKEHIWDLHFAEYGRCIFYKLYSFFHLSEGAVYFQFDI